MSGIYLHIPFCRQACHYCNFHFSTSLKQKNDFVSALLKEMEEQKQYIAGERVDSVYFGGGTPSLLEPGELQRIVDGLNTHFTIAPGAEITLEANPDDIAPAATDPVSPPNPAGSSRNASFPNDLSPTGAAKLRSWRQAGINRLSIGVQSFFEEDLRWMHRAHNAGQALDSIRMAREAGFDNISVDLIYGGPTLPDDRWRQNVEQLIRLGIPHLSCYALTVEPRTPLDSMIRLKKAAPVDPDAQARQFLLLMDWTLAAGYEHYEISNFALPGRRSRHNSSYWQGQHYLGLGPSAHSFNGVSRQWNVANNARYIDSLLNGTHQFEKEHLDPTQQINEYIMLSLRTLEGCDLQTVAERFGHDSAKELGARAQRYIDDGSMRVEKNSVSDSLILTQKGKLLADGIAGDLFV
jgi:oxygen-independent coproporphyrinogen-3 oxidase